jgi:hypothetical protein
MARPAELLSHPGSAVAFGGLLLALALAAGPAGGQGGGEGLGVSPPRIDLADAQAGETYLRTVQVQNPTDTPSGIGIQRSGVVADWTTSDPAGNFTIPAHSTRNVALTIRVPGGAALGSHSGQLTFIADPKEPPSGSGSTFRPAVGLLLNATVGGEAVTRVTWLSARVEDAVRGDPVHAFVLARNDGNVRATAEAQGAVLPFAADEPVLAEADGSRVLLAGETAEVPVTFDAGLDIGQYRARLRAGGLEETLPFKVTAPGLAAPDGELRAIVVPARSPADRPVRMDAWFRNTGNTTIASATFHGEARQDGDLLATVKSESLVVPPGGSVNLTTYWTPPRAGVYLVSGHVTYDGYQTLPKESILNVTPGGAADLVSWWWLLLLLILLALLAIWWAWRKGRRDQQRRLERQRAGKR